MRIGASGRGFVVIHAAGIRVIVAGPDGTGKTTVAKEVLGTLQAAGGLRVTHLHFRPFRRITRASEGEVPNVAPQETSARRFGQVASVLWRGMQYLSSGYSGPLARDGVDLVLQERGWPDQLVDPLRYRLSSVGRGVASVLAAIVPSPDLVVVLGGDSAVLARRKAELSEAEIARQLGEWTRLRHRYRAFVNVDTVENGVRDCALLVRKAMVQARVKRLIGLSRPLVHWPSRLQAYAGPRARPALDHLYRPASKVGRLRRKFRLRWPVSLGSATHVTLAAEALSELDVPLDTFAVIRSTGRARAVVAVVLDGRVTEFLKLGWDEGAESVRAEARMIRKVQDLPGVRTPAVLGLVETADWTALRIGALLSGETRRHDVPIELDRVVDVLISLRWCHGGRGVTHGDFRPWNLLDAENIGVIDWEHGLSEFLPGRDLFDYLMSLRDADSLEDPRLIAAAVSRYATDCHLDSGAFLRKARELGLLGPRNMHDEVEKGCPA